MGSIDLKTGNWTTANMQVFWREIAPCDHLVQIYENESHFLNTLEGFAGSGILSGDSVIIIATQLHLNQLHQRLLKHNFDVETLIRRSLYIPLEANEVLAKFMVNDCPDEKMFNDSIAGILCTARENGRKVRAFGEMVAILLEQGKSDATVKLEKLWHKLHSLDEFSLYCAYPKSVFTQQYKNSFSEICNAHSKIIDGQNRPSTEIHYTTL